MSAADEPPSDPSSTDGPSAESHAALDEVREAAGAVIASLKQLIDATERVVADPGAFASAVEGGRSIVDAFVGGFSDPHGAAEDGPDDPSADAPERDDPRRES